MDKFVGVMEEESYPAVADLPGYLILALIFPFARYLLDRYIFERQGRKYILAKPGKSSPDDQEELVKRHTKFKESCWKCSYYFVSEIYAVLITFNEPWALNSRMFWVGPGDSVWPDQKLKLKLKIFYFFIGGFYSYSIFALMFWETRRKDFGVSMSHHVAAVLLILVSYYARFGRIAAIVVAIHDLSDVFLELAKLNRYLDSEFGATVFFALFALSWLLLRIIYFPVHIIRATSYEVLQSLGHTKANHKVDGPILYYLFNILLIMLLVMHAYWFLLILRVIYKQIMATGPLDDVRSDEDEDD
eukprot:TRINITY_DN1257_c0_g1_i3.p1 TRINITY_DN1257_c0_g1~~TRINITY_DN1257_c0_g1_i3.p1  ORF type:complete len:302 (+),score=54.02 TRINITY_DN1257_c0_g1_i3:759-1664(+)